MHDFQPTNARPLQARLLLLLAFGWSIASLSNSAEIVLGGGCTLPEAIQSANENISVGECSAGEPGRDSVRFTEDVTMPRDMWLFANEDLTIIGDGHTLELENTPFDSSFPMLEFRSANIVIASLTVREGDHRLDGGCIESSGDGSLTLVGVTIENCDAGKRGGGIYALGTPTTLINSTVSGSNTRVFPNYDLYGQGGGIYIRDAPLLLLNTTVDDNSSYARGGGGIHARSSEVIVLNSTISNNVAVDENEDGGLGGGVYLAEAATLHLANSTMSNNDSSIGFSPGDGGAVWSFGSPVTLQSSTIVDNEPSGISNAPTLTVADSVFSGERACDAELLVDGGDNFADADSLCPFPELTGIDRTLANHGGATLTHALMSGSSAIGANSDCRLIPDQRGFLRDGACDSGAYEFGATEPGPLRLALAGECPGITTVSVANAVPGGSVVFLRTSVGGPKVVETEFCVGTALDVNGFDRKTPVVADDNGIATLTLDLVESDCGSQMQAVDRTTCRVSSVGVFGDTR